MELEPGDDLVVSEAEHAEPEGDAVEFVPHVERAQSNQSREDDVGRPEQGLNERREGEENKGRKMEG